MEETTFNNLNSVDVSAYTETKNTGKIALTYLSWSQAWKEVKKRYPDAKASLRFIDGKPYTYDPKIGYMVYTEVTIGGETQEMWLPVQDSHNASMLDHSYEVKTRNGGYTVPACTMSDINKALMRCMTKNLAMFGLGLYIYNGEDLPEDAEEQKTVQKPAPRPQQKPVQKSAEPSEDALRLEAVLKEHEGVIRPDVMAKCNDALNGKGSVTEMLTRLIAYLGKMGISA